MTRSLPLAFTCLTLLSLCGCHTSPDQGDQNIGFHGSGQRPVNRTQPPPTTQLPDDNGTEAPTNPPPPPPSTNTAPPPVASSPPAPHSADYPYGVPVQGKPGYVTSPYSPDTGYVDVRGFAPGQEVRDPYTNKIFLVP
jgi:hypothetical protein